MSAGLPISSFVENQLLERVAQVYRQGGPVHARVPARSLLNSLPQEQLAADMMGVLALADLNPEVVNVIAGLSCPPRAVMNDLRAVVRRDVVTTFFDRA